MADSNTISLNFKLTGEDDMKRGLADINNELKINQSEMNLVVAQYGASTTSVDGLNAKINALKNTIDTENEKVTQLKSLIEAATDAHARAGSAIESLQSKLADAKVQMEAMGNSTNTTKEQMKSQALEVQTLEKDLKQAETAYNTTGKQVTNYTTQMNNSSAAVITANKDLTANEQELRKVQSGTTTVADKVKTLANSFGVQLNPAVETAIDKIGNFSASGAALGVTVAAITAVLAKMSLNVASNVGEIEKLSSVTGMSTQSIQELQFATNMLDMDFSTVEDSMKRLQKNMAGAQDGTGDAAAAFKDLGVSVTDGANGPLKDSEDTFYEVIDALGGIQNETKRDADAMAIFGRSADDLNPIINAGSAGLQAYMEEAQQLGLVMGNDTFESFEKLNQEVKLSKEEWQATEDNLAKEFLPIATAVISLITSVPPQVTTTIVSVASAVAIIVLTIKTIKELSSGVSAVTKIWNGLNDTFSVGYVKIMAIVVALAALIIGIAAIIGKSKDLNSSLSKISELTNNTNTPNDGSIGTVQVDSSGNIVGSNAGGTTYWPGGETWVAENGAETAKFPNGSYAVLGANGPAIMKLPRGTQIWPNGVIPDELKASINHRLRGYADGTAFFPGGWGEVGERGSEFARLPGAAASGGDTYYVEINASDIKQFNRMADYFDKAKITKINGKRPKR